MKNDKRILIIEDEEILLEVLQKKLKREGFTVETARNGEEGLQKVKKNAPNLILLDIIMPKMDGYDVLEYLHKTKKYSAIPVIIISNSGQPVEIDRALKLGAVDYLIKAQFSPNEVLAKVLAALNKTIEYKPLKASAASSHTVPEQSFHQTQSPEPKTHDKIVLVAEDDQFLRELICRKLVQEGYYVVPTQDGQDAMDKINKEKPHVILLDIIMPLKNGFDVLKELRESKDKKIKDIPVILLTNLGQDSDFEKGKKLGATDYLVKASLTTEQIVNKIKEHIHGG